MTAPILAWSRHAALTYVLTLLALAIVALVIPGSVGAWAGAAGFQIFVIGTALLPLEAALLYAAYVSASTNWELAAAERGSAKQPQGTRGPAAPVPSPPGAEPPYHTCPKCGERVVFGIQHCPACQRDLLWR